jgi:integrase/recombinase XerC
VSSPATWIQAFLGHLEHERRLSPHSVSNYRRDLHKFHDYCKKQDLTDWTSLNAHHARGFVAHLHHAGLGGRSIQRALSALRSFFNYLVREELVSNNPARGVSAPKTGKPLPKTLDVDQISRLLAMDDKDPLALRDLAIMELLYSSGLRLAELTQLNLDDVDLRDAMARVTGKGNKTRVVPVGSQALAILRRWLHLRASLAQEGERALFVSRNGKRLGPRSIQQRLRQWGMKQGLTGRVHPHRLRHSFASHLLESSGDLRAVQELLGHANISTTQVYTHLDYQHLARVYDQAHPRARRRKD